MDPNSTLESVAREVGYGSGFALSTAFKRQRGTSPREHRAQSLQKSLGETRALRQR
ncbi:AraC family transcriptional regulator [Kribbella sp. NPDC023855]|uniref:AraC family transcriptional regulator n=1 Tax=Kribbella sp. NPDC023855 TaxID=3154698 RepID=UPI0033DF2358